MKIVLAADVKGLGAKGDVVEVAPGYARNYLIPRSLALQVSKGSVKQAEDMRRARDSKDRKEKEGAERLATSITRAPLTISARAGEEGQIFGSITTADIAAKLQEAVGEEIDRRRIHLAEPVRSLGTHSFSVNLRADVVAQGSIEVVAEA